MKKIFLLIFLAWLLFFIFIPSFQSPDEPEHYENIFWVSKFTYPYQPQKGQKPKFQPITLQSYHPPLYYIFGSILFHLTNFLKLNLISRFYLVRLTSGLFYFGMILLAYQTLKIIFTSKKIIYSILLFFALNPQVLRSGVGINPDIGVAFFSYLLLFLVLKWGKKILKIKEIFLLSAVSGAAALSKFSGIFTGLFFSLFYIVIPVKTGIYKILDSHFRGNDKKMSLKKSNYSNLLINFFVFYIFFFIFLSPWFYFNFKRYGTISTNAFYIAESRPINPQPFFSAIFPAAFEFRHTLMHYAGFMGARNELYPPKIFFVSYTIIIMFFALIGFLKIIKTKKSSLKIIIYYLFSIIFFLYLLSLYFKISGFSWDIQGRYFLPGFLPLVILVYFGLGKWYKLMPIFAVLHYLYILFFILLPILWLWSF